MLKQIEAHNLLWAESLRGAHGVSTDIRQAVRRRYHRELQLRRAYENNGAPIPVAVLVIGRVQEDEDKKKGERGCGTEPPVIMAVYSLVLFATAAPSG